ncbi:MAG: SpoIIE family protein phosphatase [Bacteroidales bacterium]|nr:SpoIIE family protein phosphatase [Bacteroidales bacterium]MDT8373541.1 SpoIIE family protein phosphatase [Bacteroidales bacterium]
MKPDEGFTDPSYFREHHAEAVAESLYDDYRRINRVSASGSVLRRKYADPGKADKRFWIDYAAGIPEKYISLGLFLRPCSDFCRTCIITEDDIDALASKDLGMHPGDPHYPERKHLFRELNYLIPASLKKAGYEIIRQEEITGVNKSLLMKIARAVHASYLREMKKQDEDTSGTNHSTITEFDDLPDEILQSNIDNAIHIPTRLLAIGYRIRPVRKGYKPRALHLDDQEVETMAKVEHLRWSWEKRLNGWTYGRVKDLRKKRHPCLIPYDELSDNEKEKDRELVRLTPAILRDIRYEAYPVSPDRISKLSYAIKPQSSIHKLLSGTNELSNSINLLAENSPLIREKLTSIDERIKLSLSEVEGSYNYARHIQEAFLPDDLSIRECFPDSFVLFEPKDIVSGDFYLFSRHDGHVIFGLADCTGHGIPAALISTIGYGILDQTVNILKITDPAEALSHLYSGIRRFLRKDTAALAVSDDMTIVLCNLDANTGKLTYSGAGNAIFHLTDGKISGNLSGTVSEDHFKNGTYSFSTKTLHLNAHDALYVCSDGFADQFGGGSHRRYSWRRLRDLLLQINKYPMPEQGDILYEEFDRWREEKDEDQTDDITIIGIRI